MRQSWKHFNWCELVFRLGVLLQKYLLSDGRNRLKMLSEMLGMQR